jgi:hypothetical protein
MHMMWGSWGDGDDAHDGPDVGYDHRGDGLLHPLANPTTGARRHQAVARHDAESALDILQKRYARGEISKAEFQDMRQELQDRE